MPKAETLGKTAQKTDPAHFTANPSVSFTMIPPAGIYMHWPFCLTKCGYCDFAATLDNPAKAKRYAQAVLHEIAAFDPSRFPELQQVDTLYWGGGTPSIMPLDALAAMYEICSRRFNLGSDREITVEVNPGTIDLERALSVRRMGINRISLGVQSFHDDELRVLNRRHNARQAWDAYEVCRSAGFDNVSIDLICGLPGQNPAKWRESLERAIDLLPEHISVYVLELHHGTRLNLEVMAGRISIPADEDTVASYYLCIDMLETAGYRHYEISNFALPGRCSRHNLKYWRNQPYIGFGAASHSRIGGKRYSNEPLIEEYVRKVAQTGSGLKEQSALSFRQWLGDYAITALRLREGIDLESFKKTYGFHFESYYEEAINRLLGWGLLEHKGASLRLTRESLAVSNGVFLEFI